MSIRRGAEKFVKACREGNKDAKMRLPQINYTGHYAAGQLLKGCKTLSDWFVTDIDDKDEAKRVAALLKGREEEFAVDLIEWSVNGGLHIVAKRGRGEGIEEAQKRLSAALGGIEYDTVVHDPTRVIFTTGPEDLLYLSDALFAPDEHPEELPVGGQRKDSPAAAAVRPAEGDGENPPAEAQEKVWPAEYDGFAYPAIIAKWWQLYYAGKTPTEGNRDTRTNELAFHLRALCDYQRDWLDSIIPCYDGFTEEEKLKCIDSALAQDHTQVTGKMNKVLDALKAEAASHPDEEEHLAELPDTLLKKLPKSIRASLQAVKPGMRLAALIALCPAIGALGTAVRLKVDGKPMGLNLAAFLCGNSASGKGAIDSVIEQWMEEQIAADRIVIAREQEHRRKKRSQKLDDEEEEPQEPVLYVPLNTTEKQLLFRLENAQGKHVYSFTPEADVAHWGISVNDCSSQLRQAWEESRYYKEAAGAESVFAHIPNVRWNMTLTGTPLALYRFITDPTDGTMARLSIARMPYVPFERRATQHYMLTDEGKKHISQVAHLLRYMRATVDLKKLDAETSKWCDRVCEEAEPQDQVLDELHKRVWVNAMRMTTCVMLCDVAERLLKEHGGDTDAAVAALQADEGLVAARLTRLQSQTYLNLFNILADEIQDNALYYFRKQYEAALSKLDNMVSNPNNSRRLAGRNDEILQQLGTLFNIDQARQVYSLVRGTAASQNTVASMLKNWKNQGLIAHGTQRGEWVKC